MTVEKVIPKRPGRFITLEGIEGSGKTLQLGLLEEELRRLQIAYRITREPGGTAFGQEVRKILLRHDGIPRRPIAELLLYLADRYQHLQEVVEPTLEAGVHVISDRYHDATVVYQGLARGIGSSTVAELARPLGLRVPDLTLVLDLPVGVGLQRALDRNQNEHDNEWGRFESEALIFHERVRDGYHRLAQEEPGRVQLVDANGTPPEVLGRLMEYLRPLLGSSTIDPVTP